MTARHSKLNAFGPLLAVLLTAAGCGLADDPKAEAVAGGTDESSAGSACELLVADELKGVFGKAGKEPKETGAGAFSGCEFSAEDAPFYLYATIIGAPPPTTGREQFEAERKGRKNVKPVSGIGTEAFSSTTADQTDVTFFIDDQLVTVSLVYFEKRTGDPEADVTRVAGLAGKAATRL